LAGSPLPDARVGDRGDGQPGFLCDRLGRHAFTGIYCSQDGKVPAELAQAFEGLRAGALPFVAIVASRSADPEVFDRLAVREGNWVLVRPDGYVGARIDAPTPQSVRAALDQALCLQ
jgi:3-(3-hydroxy-phenyl)propionate hydroxylase